MGYAGIRLPPAAPPEADIHFPMLAGLLARQECPAAWLELRAFSLFREIVP